MPKKTYVSSKYNPKKNRNQTDIMFKTQVEDAIYGSDENFDKFITTLNPSSPNPAPPPDRRKNITPDRDDYRNKGKIPYDNSHTSGQTSASASKTTKAPAVTSPANESTARDALAFGFGELSGDDKLFVYRKKPPIILSRLD